MKRVLENDDDQRVHEWSQYFDNIVEGLKGTVEKYFLTDDNFEKQKNWETKTFKKKKVLQIHFQSSWCAPRNSPPVFVSTRTIEMGYETYQLFGKFMDNFLNDLCRKLTSCVDRNDLNFTRHIVCNNHSFVTLKIISRTKENFTE